MTPLDQSIDAHTIRQIASGDRDAFARLYDTFAAPLYTLALRILGHPEDARDLLQEVFLKLWHDSPSYDPSRGAPIAWAITVTRNKAIDRIRSRTRRANLHHAAETEAKTLSPLAQAAPSAPDAAQQHENSTAVHSALQRLPDDLRETVDLAYFQGLSQTQIARHLGEPLSTIKSRARRAMAQLRLSLKGARP